MKKPSKTPQRPPPTPTPTSGRAGAEKHVRNAADTRARILAAARVRFSRDAFENVGTRDIAADAGVDAALVNRYFGGKEKLFEEVIAGAFLLDDHLVESMDAFGELLVQEVMADIHAETERRFDALALLLRASGSPATVHLVSACFHAEFVQPLARQLRGRDAELRATLVGSYLIGLATMRHVLVSPALGIAARRKAVALAAAAIQACVAP